MATNPKAPISAAPAGAGQTPAQTGRNAEVNCMQALAGCTDVNDAIIVRGLPMATDKAASLKQATGNDAVFSKILTGLGRNYADSILSDLEMRRQANPGAGLQASLDATAQQKAAPETVVKGQSPSQQLDARAKKLGADTAPKFPA